MTSIKPLQMIAHAITDGIAAPEVLIPDNQSYHHFVLRPSTVRLLSQADLVVWIGPELEMWMEGQLAGSQKTVVEVLSLPGLITQHSGHDHEDAVEVLIPEQGSHAGHQHKDGAFLDPHVWLDTRNALLTARAITAALIQLDADNASQYQNNLDTFQQQLAQLEIRLQTQLEPLRQTDYAVYHDAFQYFESEFGLSHSLVFVGNEELQPGVRHTLAVRQAIANRPITCLMEDVTAQASTIRALLGNHPVKRITADTTGQTLTSTPQAYIQMISNLADAFLQCQSQ
ncbi:zinc ABC transporter substrate-binding protein [Pseudohongiella spirulinae]|uniref:zinc ABC transporter substrate-binding protein n=1 Tax=Pseudohongiella spirulinae TaxID=1249552 RepID=UPI0014703032|nr:zinc ABC transporter substrate-binding protein [Pseudohongiella spirulinae]